MITDLYNGYTVCLIESVDELWALKDDFTPGVMVGVDTETDGIDYNECTTAGYCFSGGKSYTKQDYKGYYVPVRHFGYSLNLPLEEVTKFAQWVLDNHKTVFFNRPFDFNMMGKDGVQVPCSSSSRFAKSGLAGGSHDTQQMCHLIMGDSMPSLKEEAHKYLKFDVLDFESNNAKDHNFKTTDPRVSFRYAAQDPLITALLARRVWADFPYIHKIYPLDNQVNEAMRWFSLTTTLPIDLNMVKMENDRVIAEQELVRSEIFAITGYPFRLTSNQDKAEALSRFCTLTQKTKAGKFAVNEEVLQKLQETLDPTSPAHKLVTLFIKYAELEKYRGSYTDKMSKFPAEGIHVGYSTCNVSTGRYSSGGSKGNSYIANLNIQNIPKKELFKFVHQDHLLGYKVDDQEFDYCSVNSDGFSFIGKKEFIKLVLDDGREVLVNPSTPIKVLRDGKVEYSLVSNLMPNDDILIET